MMATDAATPAVSERNIIFLVGAIQFVNILDFMMVMPLGPDFARELDISISHLGYIGGAYTAAASVAGLAGSFFLDRFDRRKALTLAMLGLVMGTALGGFARGLGSLMVARVIAGAFGGPATSLSLSIVADVIPPERRGRAMGTVMRAFSLASILGVPMGLELARHGSWRTPFFAVSGLGLVLTLLGGWSLPPLVGHLAARVVTTVKPDASYRSPGAQSETQHAASSLGALLRRPTVWLAYLLTATTMMGMFTLVPNLSSYIQINLGYPRERLGLLYMIGGVGSFIVLGLAGRLVDRYGSFRVGTLSTLLVMAVIALGYMREPPYLPVLVVFVLFMCATGFRNVAFNTLLSKVPSPVERARFMSIQSAVQHFAAAVGAFISPMILSEEPGTHRIVNMPALCAFSMLLFVAMPPLLKAIEARVKPAAA